jgi:hypothetical protein
MHIKDLSVEAVAEVRGGRSGNRLYDNDYNTQIGAIAQIGHVQGDGYSNTVQMNLEDNDKNTLFAPVSVEKTSTWSFDFKNVSVGFPFVD